MRKIVLILGGTLLIALSLVTACSKDNEVPAFLNQQIRLSGGQTAVISSEGLTIKFEEVTNDSRCPTGVTCIWAGEAKCQTTITLNGASSPLVLTVTGSSDSPTVFEGFTFTANVEPYPQAEKTIDKQSYVLVLKITK
jgi:hypothetical protein